MFMYYRFFNNYALIFKSYHLQCLQSLHFLFYKKSLSSKAKLTLHPLIKTIFIQKVILKMDMHRFFHIRQIHSNARSLCNHAKFNRKTC